MRRFVSILLLLTAFALVPPPAAHAAIRDKQQIPVGLDVVVDQSWCDVVDPLMGDCDLRIADHDFAAISLDDVLPGVTEIAEVDTGGCRLGEAATLDHGEKGVQLRCRM